MLHNISVYSQAWTQHIDHIRKVFTSLQTTGLTLQLSKCKLGGQSSEFLGHHVSAGAISPQTAKVEAITNFRRPTTKESRQKLPGVNRLLQALHSSVQQPSRTFIRFNQSTRTRNHKMDRSIQLSFENLKQVLSTPPTLAPPDYSKPFLLQTDASDRGIGAVLSQDHDQEEKTVAFFSRKLLDRQAWTTDDTPKKEREMSGTSEDRIWQVVSA